MHSRYLVIPNTGFGMKVACNPMFTRNGFATSLNVWSIAKRDCIEYFQSISCWPGAAVVTLLQYQKQSFLNSERFRDGILPKGRLVLSRSNFLGRFLQGLVRRFHRLNKKNSGSGPKLRS